MVWPIKHDHQLRVIHGGIPLYFHHLVDLISFSQSIETVDSLFSSPEPKAPRELIG